MTGDGNFKWWTGSAEDADYWDGPYATRADAEAQGSVDYEGEPFCVFEADKSVCTMAIRTDDIAEQIIDSLAEQNEECWGDDGWDDAWPHDAITDLRVSLDAMVADWLKRNPPKTWAAGVVLLSEMVTPPNSGAAS